MDRCAGASVSRPVPLPETGLVHDLGNLIQVASSALSLVTRDATVADRPTLEPALDSARVALLRAGTLVREALATAREAHELGAPQLANVSACLAEVETLLRSSWEPKLRLRIHAGSRLPSVPCDHLELQNAILNLLFNARDAMPDGGLIVIEAALVHRGRAPLVELLVRDSGIGMTAETARQAFDPFFTTKGTGLGGVGLPMVRHFVERHGGNVDIESELGSGTTVTLRLPAADRMPETGQGARP